MNTPLANSNHNTVVISTEGRNPLLRKCDEFMAPMQYEIPRVSQTTRMIAHTDSLGTTTVGCDKFMVPMQYEIPRMKQAAGFSAHTDDLGMTTVW
jgi:hypothetical protein